MNHFIFKSILVIHVTRIGDTVMTSPILRELYRAYPDSEIMFLGHPKRSEIIRHIPGISSVGSITKKVAPILGWFSRNKWDLVIVYGFDKALVKYGLRVGRKKIAFNQNDGIIDNALYRPIDKPLHNSAHGIDQLFLLLRLIEIRPKSKALTYSITKEEELWSKNKLDDYDIKSTDVLIGVVIESFPTKPYRDWPVENFISLCLKIKKKYNNVKFVLLGGDISKNKKSEFLSRLLNDMIDLSGSLTLRQTASIINIMDFYIGVDTGPSHIAGALKKPMVIMYHCLHPSKYLAPPEHPDLHIFDHPKDESKCTTDDDMSKILVGDIFELIKLKSKS